MTPAERLHQAGKIYPSAWKHVEGLRADRSGLPDWPDWCFLPLSAFYSIMAQSVEDGQTTIEQAAAFGASELGALGIWRYSQGVYRIDPALFDALWTTPIGGELPADVLFRLPEWCVYIETPGATYYGKELHGYWAHLEHDVNTGRPELRLLLNLPDELLPIIIHIGRWTLMEALTRVADEANAQAASIGIDQRVPEVAAASVGELQGLISMILYLCSDEPEIDDERKPGEHPARPRPKRTKKGWRLFPAQGPRVWTVGAQLGRQLREAQATESDGRKMTPHLRRAHWHGFWTGPRDGERRMRYKWIPPIFVQGGDDAEKADQ